MAVHCGVCACRISSATDNGGSFPTDDFGGWAERSRIDDTCEDCADHLRAAVAKAALRIRSSKTNAARVAELKRTLDAEHARQTAYEAERSAAIAAVDRKFRG